MAATEVRIERDGNDPTVATLELIDTQARGLSIALSNLEPGQADDVSLLRLAADIIEGKGGSIDAVLAEAGA